MTAILASEAAVRRARPAPVVDSTKRGRHLVDTAEAALLAELHRPVSVERWARLAHYYELRAAGWRLLADAAADDYTGRAMRLAADADLEHARRALDEAGFPVAAVTG